MADEHRPKIIVDSDWKSEAQAEKERLARADEAGPRGQRGRSPVGAPPATFEELTRLLASQALVYLGAVADPQTGRAIIAPELAKFHIDLLGVLEEKTRGNLSESEAQLLSRTLYELRMAFVDVSKAVAQAVAEGRLSPGGAGPAGTGTAGPSPAER